MNWNTKLDEAAKQQEILTNALFTSNPLFLVSREIYTNLIVARHGKIKPEDAAEIAFLSAKVFLETYDELG